MGLLMDAREPEQTPSNETTTVGKLAVAPSAIMTAEGSDRPAALPAGRLYRPTDLSVSDISDDS